jgi:hypothetical protein
MISVDRRLHNLIIYFTINKIRTDIVTISGYNVEYLWSFDSRGNIYYVKNVRSNDGFASIGRRFIPLIGQLAIYSGSKLEDCEVPFTYNRINIFNLNSIKIVKFSTKVLRKYFINIYSPDGSHLMMAAYLNKVYFGYLSESPVYCYDIDTEKYELSEYRDLRDVIKIKKAELVYFDAFTSNESIKNNQYLSKNKVPYDIFIKFK